MRQQAQAQRRRITYKYGQEFLALIDGDPNTRVIITDIVQKLVFRMKRAILCHQTDGSLVGKVIQVRFGLLHREVSGSNRAR